MIRNRVDRVSHTQGVSNHGYIEVADVVDGVDEALQEVRDGQVDNEAVECRVELALQGHDTDDNRVANDAQGGHAQNAR